MLIVGSSKAIKTVILLKWQRVGTSNRVNAFAELYEVGDLAAPDLKQRVVSGLSYGVYLSYSTPELIRYRPFSLRQCQLKNLLSNFY